jgi:hypothetical protein
MLAWFGRRPAAQHCSSASDLGSTLMFSEGRLSVGPGGGWRQGEVVAVRRDGAVLEVEEKDKVEDKGKEEDVDVDVVLFHTSGATSGASPRPSSSQCRCAWCRSARRCSR